MSQQLATDSDILQPMLLVGVAITASSELGYSKFWSELILECYSLVLASYYIPSSRSQQIFESCIKDQLPAPAPANEHY